MPQTAWEEINDIIHKFKGTLTKVTQIEQMCKKVKQEALEGLEEMEGIILKQVNGGDGDG